MIEKHPHDKFLKALVILNLLDLCITIFAVEGGFAEEVNPVMGYFLENSVISFAMFKIFVMQHALLVEYDRWVKKDKLSKKWVWYFLITAYVATVTWNIVTVSLHAAGVI
jgi:hypothetical protein